MRQNWKTVLLVANGSVPEGQGITAEIQAAILEINRFVSDGILPEDLAVFYRTLRTITENLEAAVERYLTE